MNFNKITRFANRAVIKTKKHSPEIMFYGGLVGVVATTILSSRATLKAVPVAQQHQRARVDLEERIVDDNISRREYSHGVVETYTITAMQIARLYAPTLVVGGLSIAALTKSHRQLTSRNAALTVAYTGLFKTFEKYRERVQEELGDEQDRRFLHGTVSQEIEVEGKNGKIKKENQIVLDKNSSSALTHWFDANTESWCKDPSYNQNMLDNQQQWANVLLKRQGHLFLNEVYDLLHIPHTREGNILGWIYEDLGNNDMFITFGHQKDGEFVAGFTRDVMLEFNIHGPILDLI